MNTDNEDYGDASQDAEEVLPGRPDLRVGFILLNQFTLVPVAGLVDSLRFAADKSFRSRQIYCQWDWMTCNDEPISASCGMPILPTKRLELLESYDYIVVAGGLLAETRNPPEWLLDALRNVHAAGIPIIALCSASFVLGKAGLLDGRRCAVHFTIRDEFSERFPLATALIDKSYVDDEGIITCPGGTAIDLAANMIRRHCGEIRAQKGLKYLLADTALETAPEHERDSEPHVYQNEIVRKAIAFMRAHLGASATLKEVAEHAGTSARQLHRAFLNNTNDAPANYWRKLRLEHARKQLADTSLNVTTIAIECGFSDASHFILWFRKQYGETPSVYRKRRHEVERLLTAH
ncbi:GlxA family transcriptional regulator [Burkholderia sp. IMCC1007]|uniref:GlxA family transcriptional regulator n=1 Tax=Burkholderia sp. IMCC1007 TaxID=3004104 RepID=UPI0022B3A41C|nr:GlxA family transcriptional regulator [Burkholderia sp. IMCC1007]